MLLAQTTGFRQDRGFQYINKLKNAPLLCVAARAASPSSLCVTATVTAMALGPDCQLLVAASRDGSIVVWNMKVFEMLHALPGHSAELSPFFEAGKLLSCQKRAVAAWQSWSFRHTDTSQPRTFS